MTMNKPGTLAALHDQAEKDLKAQQEQALAELQPLYDERDALVSHIQPLEAKLREVQQRIKAAEEPLRAAGNDLATIARARGARTLVNEGPAQPETFTPDSPATGAGIENAAPAASGADVPANPPVVPSNVVPAAQSRPRTGATRQMK